MCILVYIYVLNAQKLAFPGVNSVGSFGAGAFRLRMKKDSNIRSRVAGIYVFVIHV